LTSGQRILGLPLRTYHQLVKGGRLVAAVLLAWAMTAACDRPPAPGPVQPGPAGGISLPPVAGRVDYQLGGAYPPPIGVTTVTRDREAAPAAGLYGICYVNAFQTQPQETVWWQAHHPDLLLRDARGPVSDPGWPGEVLLDPRTAQKRAAVASVVGGWVDGCAARGYRAVEPDNLDSWTRSHGLITRDQAVAFARLLTARGHRDHLAVAQKNTAELAPRGRAVGFDFAVAEECQVFNECDAYTAAYGTHVIEIEYTDNGRVAFATACRVRHGRVSIVLRDRPLTPAGSPAYAYAAC